MAHHHGDISLDLILNESIDLSKLPDDDRHRIEHARMHEKHRGHEKMHGYMILILLAAVVIAQIILVNWKKLHFKSYQRVTMMGMWLIPVCISVHSHWWRFVFIWTIFTVGTCIVMSWALQKPIAGTTPRWVYKWFYVIYLQSCAVCVFGYVVVMLTLLGVNVVFRAKPQSWMDVGLLFLFYGVYYGVLSRDVSEAVTDRMACTIGYYTTTGVPVRQLESNVCAVCGNKIHVLDNSDAIVEESYKLPCGHIFHEFCIRGWCIVGKKQTCPYCKEKVDLKRMFCSPWEKPHILYGNFLDFIRYLVVWQPVIIVAVQFLNQMLGLE
ncbi:LOW QUALITY PROTEIN: RING finger protein 121-like [Rhipicephalus sanguineus]|uniref:LOW QUALITY PROTEIN: RING finger protein 121-like n=1 Tax=Rhipicephalus sanguineus TaxID=34632 RepID=UPI001894F2AA|nr:LOW QUALITY PROTEIN: RING finger protein 121-like [Rhipicephalus sanguineus]